jgi:copper(I)-binding protein
VGAVLIAVLIVAGCGAGQQPQTANQVPASGGAAGAVDSIQVRDAHFAWSGPVPGDSVHQLGDDAPLQVTIINNATSLLDDGFAPDRLLAVSSPIATSGRIVGDATIPDGQVLTAGYDQPVASIALPGTREVEIALVGLTEPIRAGVGYPVVFTFERAGDLRLDVPVENPQIPPPRARDGEPE